MKEEGKLRNLLLILVTVHGLALAFCVPQANGQKSDTVPLTDIKAGVGKVDITPPIGVHLVGYGDRKGPSTDIHSPLHAVVIVFDDGKTRAAIVSLDLLFVSQPDGDAIRKAIEEATGISGDHIIINVSHTHGGPKLAHHREEICAKLAGAAILALSRLRPVSLGYEEGKIDFNVNRRCIDEQGKCYSGLNPKGICDHRVKILRIDDGDSIEPMAVIMHAVCHANVFRGANTEISSDFPGYAKTFVERNFGDSTTTIFLQGCTGDIRPNLPSVGGWRSSIDDFGRSGNEVDMIWCGWTLGAEAVKIVTKLRVRELVSKRSNVFKISTGYDILKLRLNEEKLKTTTVNKEHIENGKLIFPIRVIKIGNIWFISLPGEPVVEYGLKIEREMDGLGKVFVLGYDAGYLGYVPVSHMFKEGGYEAECPLTTSCEKDIINGVKRLVDNMIN